MRFVIFNIRRILSKQKYNFSQLKEYIQLEDRTFKEDVLFRKSPKIYMYQNIFLNGQQPGKRGGGEYISATPAIWCYIMERNLLIVRLKNLSTSGERDTCEVDGSTRSSLRRWSEKRNKMPRRNGEREKKKNEGEGRGVKQGRGHS